MRKINLSYIQIMTAMAVLMAMVPDCACAYTIPSGGMGYDLYDYAHQFITGAPGFIIALIVLGMCFFFIVKTNAMGAILCGAVAFGLAKIEDIAVSFGAIIS